jgi:hypothetical protein
MKFEIADPRPNPLSEDSEGSEGEGVIQVPKKFKHPRAESIIAASRMDRHLNSRLTALGTVQGES